MSILLVSGPLRVIWSGPLHIALQAVQCATVLHVGGYSQIIDLYIMTVFQQMAVKCLVLTKSVYYVKFLTDQSQES